MKVKAMKSFSGACSMCVGEVREINTPHILKDLLSAGYVEPVTPKRGAKNESQRDNTE